VVSSDASGSIELPGIEGAAPQPALLRVSPLSASEATATILSGDVSISHGSAGTTTYAAGTTLMLTRTPWGIAVSQGGQQLGGFCTTAERAAGQDAQHCGS
jgi:hypothetical protein